MSDTPDTTIAALRNRLRELELDAVMIRGRVEELTATLETLEGAQKPRGRRSAAVTLTGVDKPKPSKPPPGPAAATIQRMRLR